MKLRASQFQPPADFLKAVFHQGDIVEMRLIAVDGTVYTGKFNDLAHMAKVAAYLEHTLKPKATYYTLNPIRPEAAEWVGAADWNVMIARGPAARDNQIARRNLYLVDIDSVRSSGTSATKEERQYAHAVMDEVRRFLSEHEFPEPICLDTGNGYALLYGTDHHNPTTATWPYLLKRLAERFDNEFAKVDTSVTNASRISRLPGTWNRKGENTPERPHRMCKVIHMPERPTRMTHVTVHKLATALGYTLQVDMPRTRLNRRLLIDEDGVVQLIEEFPDQLELGRITHDGEVTYFELLSCPFNQGEHSNQRVGKGKTTLRLAPNSIGFCCFSDDCHDHTFGALLRLLKEETGRSPSMPIWAPADLTTAIRRWGGVIDVEREETVQATSEAPEEWQLYLARAYASVYDPEEGITCPLPPEPEYELADLYEAWLSAMEQEVEEAREDGADEEEIADLRAYNNPADHSPASMERDLEPEVIDMLFHLCYARERWGKPERSEVDSKFEVWCARYEEEPEVEEIEVNWS